MIVSCSRRTDIPAFFGDWFMDKIEKGYCVSVNPFNRNQCSYISLKPEDVDIFVFWTKDPKPFLKNIDNLMELNYNFYFQYTLNDYPKLIEPNIPSVEERVESLIELSNKIGRDKVIWRYDPIMLTNETDYEYHKEKFNTLLERVYPYVDRVVVSIYDNYKGADNRLGKYNFKVFKDIEKRDNFKELMSTISINTSNRGLNIFSCAETIDLTPYGILPGKCIDDEYIRRVFKINISSKKDKNQRKECGCIESKDIGFYNTCPHKCLYCYANYNEAVINRQLMEHSRVSPSVIGFYDVKPPECRREEGVQISFDI